MAITQDEHCSLGAFADATYPDSCNGDSYPEQRHSPETWLLHARVHLHRDPAALEELVHMYDDEARKLARRRGYRRTQEDLVQVAREALVVALLRFDPGRRRPFLPFARMTIDGMVRRHLRDHGYTIRPSRRSYELLGTVNAARDLLTNDLRREPTVSEIADFLGEPVDEISACIGSGRIRVPLSLDGFAADDNVEMHERIGAEDSSFEDTLDRMALIDGLTTLQPDQREVLYAYFFEERTQADIAAELGVTQMTVSRTLRRSIRTLRPYVIAQSRRVRSRPHRPETTPADLRHASG